MNEQENWIPAFAGMTIPLELVISGNPAPYHDTGAVGRDPESRYSGDHL